jgi:simple sugar transport system ATP-binding protein
MTITAAAPTGGPASRLAAVPVPAAPPAVEAIDLCKTFGNFRALDRVSLRIAPGSFHALLGENGAGKSTLVKCIMGYHQADSGHLMVDQRAVTVRNPREAQLLGIGMVYQHFTLVPNMTVAENLVLSRAAIPFLVDWKQERRALAQFMERMPFRVPLDAPVRSLAAGEKQKVEICKQLYLVSRVVILDEPTSVLTPGEADEVLGMLRTMARAGEISVLIITHKFREVMSFADEVTVLRRGRLAGRGPVRGSAAGSGDDTLSPAAMAQMMVGDAPEMEAAHRTAGKPGEPRLRVDCVSADDDLGIPALREVSFDVRAGEIVGIAGVAGNGQEELVEVLAGQRAATAGKLWVHGREYLGSREEIRRHRVRCLPEEPMRNACVPTMTVAENIAFRDFDRPPYTVGGVGLRPRAIRDNARRAIAEYKIKTPSPDAAISQLSGGNVQRAVLARELGGEVEVLIAANPCMGLDFAAVAEIQARLVEARNRGAAVLLVSADLDEVFALSDRILVMSDGRITHQTPIENADVGVIGRHMAGHA